MARTETLRVAILAQTLPSALRVYCELETLPRTELFIILCRAPSETRSRFLLKHAAHFLRSAGRLKSLRLALAGRVFLLQKPLDHPESLELLSGLQLDIGLHKIGVIYREATIRAFRLGILNPHIGILPRYRGRAVMEWSMLEGYPTGITLFFIDAGIDTGERIIFSEQVEVRNLSSIDEAKRYLFSLDAPLFRRAIEMLREEGFDYTVNDLGQGRRYYVMSGLFRSVVEELLSTER